MSEEPEVGHGPTYQLCQGCKEAWDGRLLEGERCPACQVRRTLELLGGEAGRAYVNDQHAVRMISAALRALDDWVG